MDRPGPAVQLRTATPSDAEEVAVVYRRASLGNPGDRDALLAHPDALDLDPAPLLAGRTVVAVADGRVVGFATCTVDGSSAELDDLFVDPEAQRRGIARALVDAVTDRARAAGASRLEVTANEHARAFYTAADFVETGITTTRFGPAPRMRRAL